MLYKQVCTRQGDKTNRWSLSLSLSVGGHKRRTCNNQSPTCTHLLIAAQRAARRIVSKSTVAQRTRGSAMAEGLRDTLVSRNSE